MKDTSLFSTQSAFIFSNADLTASSGGIGCDAIVKGGIWIITSSGAQMIRGAVAATIHAESSSGSIYAEELVAGTDYSFETSSGSICLTNVICGGTLKAESTSGDVLLDGCDAGHVIIETSSGNVKGSLRTGKQFKVKTGSGSVSVPADAAGGQCEIRTTSGNVSITVG